MIKKIAAVVLILLAGGGWFYLDYMNKQAQQAAEESRLALEQMRAKARAAEKAKFEALILADLNTCKEVAEKAKTDFLDEQKKPVKRKPGEFTIPPAAIEQADKTLAEAIAACQAAYEARAKSGT